MGRVRVIQWATGNTGLRALREVIRHPDLDLVGVLVYDEAKAGVDPGKLCDEADTGVLATTDRDEVLQLDADCCVYMPRATGRGRTRAGLTEDEAERKYEHPAESAVQPALARPPLPRSQAAHAGA